MSKVLYERDVPQETLIEEASAVLQAGGIVVVPTDTVPGIGCRANDLDALTQLFRLKERPGGLAIPIIVADAKDVELYSAHLPPVFRSLAARYWPGALTIVVSSNGKIDPLVGGGGSSLGFRVPDCPFLRGLVRNIGCPLALTSANPHGMQPSGEHSKLLEWWDSKVDLIILGRSTLLRPPSAVADISTDRPRIVREGTLDQAELTSLLTQNRCPKQECGPS